MIDQATHESGEYFKAIIAAAGVVATGLTLLVAKSYQLGSLMQKHEQAEKDIVDLKQQCRDLQDEIAELKRSQAVLEDRKLRASQGDSE